MRTLFGTLAALLVAIVMVLAAPVTRTTVQAAPAMGCYDILMQLQADGTALDGAGNVLQQASDVLTNDVANGADGLTIMADYAIYQQDGLAYVSALNTYNLTLDAAKQAGCA